MTGGGDDPRTPGARRKRLLIVATEFPPGPGGIGTHAHQLALHAAESGWAVTVLTPQQYVTARTAEAFDLTMPFTVIRLEVAGNFAGRSLARLRLTLRALQWIRPHVVVASGNWAVWLTGILGAIVRLPRRVAVGHGMEFGRQTPLTLVLNRIGYGAATAVVCVSDYTCTRMRQAGIKPRRVEVIPNGGDARVFSPGESPTASEPRPFTILSVGNVSERKGQDVVVRALPLLVAQGLDVHYVVVGLPTRSADLRQLAADLGVTERLHIRGHIPLDALISAYRSCDVFSMTSREVASGDFEGYGIAVLEAALCGKPAVVTAGSGLEEAVVAGETGLVVPRDDPAAFADAVASLAHDRELLARLGSAALRRASTECTWDSRLDGYLELFDAIMALR